MSRKGSWNRPASILERGEWVIAKHLAASIDSSSEEWERRLDLQLVRVNKSGFTVERTDQRHARKTELTVGLDDQEAPVSIEVVRTKETEHFMEKHSDRLSFRDGPEGLLVAGSLPFRTMFSTLVQLPQQPMTPEQLIDGSAGYRNPE